MDNFIKDQANGAQLLIFRLNFWIPTYLHIFNFLYKEGNISFFFAIYTIKNDYIFKFSSYFGGCG